MTLHLLCATLLALPIPFRGKERPAAADKAVTGLVQAEQQFNADAAQLGVRAAFLKWLAAEAMMFHPHPTGAREVYAALPPARSGFARQPARMVLSNGEDLALSSGGWTFRSDSAQARVDVYGAFATLWRREKDGWRIEFDCGLPQEAPKAARPALATSVLPRSTRGGSDSRGTLAQAEVEFAAAAGARGLPAALAQYADADASVLRWGAATTRDSVAGLDDHVTLRPRERIVASSGDLGYGYGDFIRRRGSVVDSTNYLHVWQRDKSKQWRILLDYVEGAPHKVK